MSASFLISLAIALGAVSLYLNTSGDIKSIIGIVILPLTLICFLLAVPFSVKLAIFIGAIPGSSFKLHKLL